jgi:hypothetical protein
MSLVLAFELPDRKELWQALQSCDHIPTAPQQRPDTLIHLFVAREQLTKLPPAHSRNPGQLMKFSLSM